jgi:hypothetical protein
MSAPNRPGRAAVPADLVKSLAKLASHGVVGGAAGPVVDSADLR